MCSSRNRAVARFFCNGAGHFRECRRHQPCWGVWTLRNAIFSTCHEIWLRKIDLGYENGKQLQVTIIKITEPKEYKSIRRLDVSSLTGQGGGGGEGAADFLAPLLATALRSISNLISLRKILRHDFAFSGTLRLFTVYVVISYVSVLKRVL